MKQLLLMFVILTTSIINAQTFDFGCGTTASTAAEELAALFAQSEHRPDDLNDYPLTAGEVNTKGTAGSFIVYAANSLSINSTGVQVIYNAGFNFTYNGESNKIINDATDISGHPALFLELLQAKFDLLYPSGPTIESETEDFYASTEPPTGFIANSLIDAEAQSFHDGQPSSRGVFLATLKSSSYQLVSASPVDGYVVYNISSAFNASTIIETITADVSGSLTKQQFSDFTFKLMLAVWHLEHPNYEAIAAAEQANVQKIRDLNGSYGVTSITTNIIDGDIVATYVQDGNPVQNFSFGTYASFGVIPQTVFDTKFAQLETKLQTDQDIDLPALRAQRIADLEALDQDNIIVYKTGDNIFNINFDGALETTAFRTSDYGAPTFEELTVIQYTAYKNAIIAQRAVLVIEAELARLAALRTTRINQLVGLADSPSTVEHMYSPSNFSDIFIVDGDQSVGTPQTFLTKEYGAEKVENIGAERYADLIRDIDAKVDELNPLSEYNLKLELEIFYGRSHIDVFNQVNYGDKLPERLETAANNAFDAGLAAQETFIKFLANGASFRGGDSYVIWDSSNNYYHIVTSNVGSGNGYFDIRLDDNHHYLPGASGTITKTNFRHLAWHTMSNLWHLAGTTDEELVVFRETEMTVYADANPDKSCTCDWRAGQTENSHGVTVYFAEWENFHVGYCT